MPRDVSLRRLLAVVLLASALVAGTAPAEALGSGTPKPKPKVAITKKTQPAVSQPRPLWTPRDATVFNYPLADNHWDKYRIRRVITKAIKNSPRGSSIRLTTFTFIDDTITDALVAAHKRGVSIQVLVNKKNSQFSAPLKRLKAALRKKARRMPANVQRSFIRTCKKSCRGRAGNLHSKIYLFSQVGRAPYVSMISSANLTTFAAVGQWNHLDTLVGKEDYDRLLAIFDQMKRDRPSPPVWFTTKKMQAYVFPRMGTTAKNDPMVQSLANVRCTYRGTRAGKPVVLRSRLRIAMYAWFDQRGNNLAKVVRQKWNQGCDVKIIYAIMNGASTRTLRAKTGRGPIPMRRSVTLDSLGEIVDYNHSKYTALSGWYGGEPRQLVWTGSMNFTQLGIRSDDLLVRLSGTRVLRSYLRNFHRVWYSPSSKKP